MKKNVIISAITVLVMIACIFLNDWWVYFMSWLMALPVIVTIVGNRGWTVKISRWAKANAFKAQLLVSVMQFALFAIAIIAGYNFKQLGYGFSTATPFVFGILTVFSFFSVPFLPKRRLISIPKVVNKQRFAFLGIVLSSFVLLVVFGSRIDEKKPGFITQTVRRIDQAIFPTDNTFYSDPNDEVAQPDGPESINPGVSDKTSSAVIFASFSTKEKATTSEKKASRLEKKQLKMIKRLLKHRLAFAAALSAGAVLLFILLIFTSCAGICFLIAGFAGLGGSGSTGAALGLIAIGALITIGSALGIKEIFRNKENR